MESVRAATKELIKSGDLHMAKSLEQKLADIEQRFSKVQNLCEQRDGAFQEVSSKLTHFHDELDSKNTWLQVC